MANQPFANTAPSIVVTPVLWFVDRLAIELEDEFRVARFQNVSVDILMAGDASVRAHIKISQIVHAGGRAHRVGPIGASMAAEPRFGRAVTTFAGNAFVRARGGCQASLSNRLKRRMTNGAAGVRLRLRDADRFADAGRPRVQQNCVGAGVKIFL